ncbi:MAG: SpoIIE family protein phosphatase, partial [Anaerolineae bacterium]|nr:SpoIIE family protein phosphatase [Anaerolineae bacterium]
VRDGAVARAAHDYLRTQRGGKVSATLNLASVDLASRTLVLLRNNHCPILLYNPHWTGVNTPDGWQYLDEPSEAIGVHARTRPIATELPLQQDLTALIFTDGIWTAGERSGQRISIPRTMQEAFDNGVTELNDLADFLLTRAVELDQRRPADDMSLVILGIRRNDNEDEARRMTVSLPF